MDLNSLFVPLMAYVQSLDRQQAPEAQRVFDNLQQQIRQARDQAVAHGVELQRFHEALFPVVAWVDERLSCLPDWQETRPWRAFMLQRKLFSTSLAGVQFFERMQVVKPDDNELREVFVTCLALGFVGRYSQNPNSPELTELKQTQYRLLRPSTKGAADGVLAKLFPESYRLVQGGRSRRSWRINARALRLLIIIVPVFLIVGMALWFDQLLGQQVTEITRALP